MGLCEQNVIRFLYKHDKTHLDANNQNLPKDITPICQIKATKYMQQRNRVRVESHRNRTSQIGKIFHFRTGEEQRTLNRSLQYK